MLKPPPTAAIPGVTDTLDFVKNLWGSMSLPGAGLPGMSAMAGPPMSVEDLDKRIADMKAVESWLNLNLSMLRGTIQAMEVQRSTLITLKSMGASMAEAMRQSGVSAEKMANTPFAPFFGQAAGDAGTAQPGTSASSGSAQDDAPPPGMPAALAWWNLLQEQFQQAVATAMTPSPAPDLAGSATQDSSPAAKPAPASDTGAKPRESRSKADKG